METLENKLSKRLHAFLYALAFLTILLGLSVLLEGCTDRCEVERTYVYYEPVYQTTEEIRAAVAQVEPVPFSAIGKIYVRGTWLFVNQPGKGIHVIDNRSPAHPVLHSFINVPGSYELAVKGNTLYTDSFIDLVLLDISDMNNIHEAGRMEGIFTEYNSMGIYYNAGDVMVLTDWVETEEVVVTKSDCETTPMEPWGGWWYDRGFLALADGSSFNKSAAMTPGTGSGPGVGGSMARFTINGNHLYMLDAGKVQSVDISSERNPEVRNALQLDWGIETIFPYGKNLFVGANAGMHILDVSDPDNPVKVSTYEHVRVCDPVVVQGSTAYVTLRSGSACAGFTNQLEVIDISDLAHPTVMAVHPMHNPHGLGIDESTLFICDGDAGLKVFDASDADAISSNLLAHYNDIHAFDVIPYNNVLMMIGEDGIFQFDYTDPGNITLLSKIELVDEQQ